LSELKIELPKRLNFYTIDSVLEEFVKLQNKPYNNVIFDLRQINFVEPRGVTLLTNLISWLKSRDIKYAIEFIEIENNSESNLEAMRYLRDSGFFKINGFEGVYGEQSLRDTMLPISKIETDKIHQWNDFVFLEYLRSQTKRRSEFSHLRVAIEEIFNNISDHSTEQIGCCFAQFYPKNNEIQISISDFGIGIPNALRENSGTIDIDNKIVSKKLNDRELLEIAVREGVSTKAKPSNRGAGFTNITNSLTNEGIGQVYIRSNNGEIWIHNKEITNTRQSNNFYPGTFYDIILYTDNESLFDYDIEEEFEW